MVEFQNGAKAVSEAQKYTIYLGIGDGELSFENEEEVQNFLKDQIGSLVRMRDRDDAVGGVIQPLIGDLIAISGSADAIVAGLNRLYREKKACLALNIGDVIRVCSTSAQKREAISHLLRGREDGSVVGAEADGAGKNIAICYELLMVSATTGQMASELRSIRDRYVRQYSELESFSSDAKEDWKQRIDGYEAKVALSSPREYWKEKGKKHEEKSLAWRSIFLYSLIGSIVAIGFLGAVLIESSRSGVLSKSITSPNIVKMTEEPSRQADGIKAASKESDVPVKPQEKSRPGSLAEQQGRIQAPVTQAGVPRSIEGAPAQSLSHDKAEEPKARQSRSLDGATAPYDGAMNAFFMIREGIIFATILALVVWGLRQILRIWLMHEHLEEDAKERVAMIETYAAMKKEGFELQDRNKIIEALYRNATTGLIKEDSGPATPFEIIVKTVADVAQRR